MTKSSKPVVAHYIRAYLGRTETFVYEQLRHLTSHNAIIITNKIIDRDSFPFDPIYYPLLPLPLRALDRYSFEYLAQAPFANSWHRSTMAAQNVALVHAHLGLSGLQILPVTLSLRIPLIVSFYGFDASVAIYNRWHRSAFQRLFNLVDLVLVEGSRLKKRLEDAGCDGSKLKIQRIPVNLDQFSFIPRKLKPGEKIKILMCGRFVEKKGFPVGIKAFANVCQGREDLELRIVGDGPERAALENLVRELKVERSVKFLGFLDYEAYSAEVRRIHLFMAPSLTASNGDTEGGAPTALLEMQASGVPVISTLHADIPEVVLDGKSAFLVPERNVEMLSQRLNYLVCHPEIWAEMGEAGRRFVEERHDVNVCARNLELIYTQVLRSAQAER